MSTHTKKLLTTVLMGAPEAGISKKEAFRKATALSKGACRLAKLEKAWRQVVERIEKTPSKKYRILKAA